eukprot:2667702-Pyramimonas_sp.AAC.1
MKGVASTRGRCGGGASDHCPSPPLHWCGGKRSVQAGCVDWLYVGWLERWAGGCIGGEERPFLPERSA